MRTPRTYPWGEIGVIMFRSFGITFGIAFVFNVIMSTVVYSIAHTDGYEGAPAFSWDQYMGTLGGLFGDIPSLIGLLVAVLVLCLMAWGVRRLSMTGHHNWVVICFLLGLTLGGLILWVWVDWSSFGFGFGPFIILVVATAVEAILIQLLANRRR